MKMGLTNKMYCRLIVLLLLLAVTFTAGCVSQPTGNIKSQEDVQKSLPNITKNIEGIGQTLQDLDKKLG